MEPNLPWYKSAILRQQIVQLIVSASALSGIALPGIDWDATVSAIFAGIAAAIAVWTIVTRLFNPAPNITVKAAQKEQALVAKGTIPKQGGFARLGVLILLALGAFATVPFVSGCAGTQSAYREARENGLADIAYVVTEHYAAVLKEAADLRQSPGTPREAIEAMQRADRAVKPIILGDPARDFPSLRKLVEKYQAIGDAKTEADLQARINDAIREISNFSKAVKAAKVQP